MTANWPNKITAANAGQALSFQFLHPWPGIAEFLRSVGAVGARFGSRLAFGKKRPQFVLTTDFTDLHG
jgi:hypothetical protein